jgi:hypothetical protein
VRIVLALRTRDQADTVDALLSFHLNVGVDFVVATDHRSQDGTVDILEAYAREGVLRLIRETGEEVRGQEWRTRMARLAAAEHGADWVIHCDGDEFWWPRGASLKEVLEVIPARYGVVQALVRHFPPRLDEEGFFAERMTVRLAPQAPISDPTSPFRPDTKIAHRAHPEAVVDRGASTLLAPPLLPLRSWYPLEVLHFPIRGLVQWQAKALAWHQALPEKKRGKYARAVAAEGEGTLAERYRALCVEASSLPRGQAEGSLVIDTRLRDVLRSLRLQEPTRGRSFRLPQELASPLALDRPGLVEEAAYAVDVAVAREDALARLQRQVDELERRVHRGERRPWQRLRRRLLGLLRPSGEGQHESR